MASYTHPIFTLAASSLLWLLCSTTQALELSLQDPQLRLCINQQAEQQHWQSAGDITALECHNQNITTLAGIEQLSNLHSLSLYNNAIHSLGRLQLPKLTLLNLAKNKLTELTLGDLPELQTLYVFNNQLQQLTLKSLPKLSLLKANNNVIANFNYSDLPALEKLYLFDNKMADIDIYHLPRMTYMDVRQNPMPDKLYEDMDKLKGVTFLHNGNSRDWQ